MNRNKNKRIARRVMAVLTLLLLSPFLYRGLLNGLPYLNAAAYQMAVWSAGLTLPEGGNYIGIAGEHFTGEVELRIE